jgi:hypothetical protein
MFNVGDRWNFFGRCKIIEPHPRTKDLGARLVNEVREIMVRKYRKAFAKLEGFERAAFGENSFFRHTGGPKWKVREHRAMHNISRFEEQVVFLVSMNISYTVYVSRVD